jgi:radical SAM superfamily enzyme YgiQ (UPF0313 family)
MGKFMNATGDNKRLKILICKPRLAIQTIRLNRLIRCEPLELEYLYTILQHHELTLLDGIVDRRDPVKLAKKLKFQIVLFTSLITTVPDVLKTAARLKKLPEPPLILVGGPDAEVCPEHFYHESIDGVFFANQLEAVTLVVDRILEGKPYHDVPGAAFQLDGKFVCNPSASLDPRKLPRVRHFLLGQFPGRYKIIYYKPCASIKTSFGCPAKCTFCFSTEMHGGVYGARPIEDVVDEIAEIPVRNILIMDDDFLINRNRLLEFCGLLHQRKIEKEFIAIGNARFIAQNPDVMRKLRNAGVAALMVGFEFVTNEELVSINKEASLADNNRTIEICRELDIDLFALFIVDPEWRHADFRKLANYLKNNYIPFALFSTLTVFPGTKLAQLNPQPIPDQSEWWRYDLLRLHQTPKHMSATLFYLWLFYLYMIPGMRFLSLKKHRKRYGISGLIAHSVTSFLMGMEYLFKLLIWR